MFQLSCDFLCSVSLPRCDVCCLRSVIVAFMGHTHLLFAVILLRKIWLFYFNCLQAVVFCVSFSRGSVLVYGLDGSYSLAFCSHLAEDFVSVPDVMYSVSLLQGVACWSEVCDYGISWSFSLMCLSFDEASCVTDL